MIGPVPQGALELMPAAADLRTHVLVVRIEVGPLQIWVHERRHGLEIAARERLAGGAD